MKILSVALNSYNPSFQRKRVGDSYELSELKKQVIDDVFVSGREFETRPNLIRCIYDTINADGKKLEIKNSRCMSTEKLAQLMKSEELKKVYESQPVILDVGGTSYNYSPTISKISKCEKYYYMRISLQNNPDVSIPVIIDHNLKNINGDDINSRLKKAEFDLYDKRFVDSRIKHVLEEINKTESKKTFFFNRQKKSKEKPVPRLEIKNPEKWDKKILLAVLTKPALSEICKKENVTLSCSKVHPEVQPDLSYVLTLTSHGRKFPIYVARGETVSNAFDRQVTLDNVLNKWALDDVLGKKDVSS